MITTTALVNFIISFIQLYILPRRFKRTVANFTSATIIAASIIDSKHLQNYRYYEKSK